MCVSRHVSRLPRPRRTGGVFMVVTGTDSYFRTPSSRRGEALWEREAAGSGSLGAASSESAAGSVRLLGCGC